MTVVGFDTATPATAVGVLREDGTAFERRHDPEPGERPAHVTRLLGLIEAALADAERGWEHVARLAVGVGPGTFTGLRIGIATARGLAQARDLPLVGVSTLRALADGARADAGEGAVLAVLDARRGEAFAAAYAGEAERLAPVALSPADLARAAGEMAVPGGPPALAVGDGALRFREELERIGAVVPADGSPLHRVDARHVCRRAAAAPAPGRAPVVPAYLRLPDAELAARQRTVP